jgi:hypothetical protein
LLSIGFAGFPYKKFLGGIMINRRNSDPFVCLLFSIRTVFISGAMLFSLFSSAQATEVSAPSIAQISLAANKTQCLYFNPQFTAAGMYSMVMSVNTCNAANQAAESFEMFPVSGSFGSGFQLSVKSTGMCVQTSVNSSANGVSVIQGPCGNSTQLNQIWMLQPVGSSYNLISAANKGMCLDLQNGTIGAASALQQWQCGAGNQNQIWNISVSQPDTTFAQALPMGPYQLNSSANSNKCIDLSSGQASGEAEINDCSGYSDKTQLWNLIPAFGQFGHGYQIASVSDGKCLGVTGNSTVLGALVQEQPCGGTSALNQIWQVQPYKSGFQFVSANSGMCLDLRGGSETDGTSIWQYTCNAIGTNSNQIWSLSMMRVPNNFPVANYNASGSPATQNCSITTGSKTLSCPSAGDFKVGQGILITGAGATPMVADATVAPTVSSSLPSGTHTHCYEVVFADPYNGIGAPSPTTCISNTGAFSERNVVGLETTQFAGYLAAQYLWYVSDDNGPYQYLGRENAQSFPGDRGIRQPQLAEGYPLTITGTARIKNQDLISTILSISGGTITLADPASKTVSSVLTAHDDTMAIQNAIDAAEAAGGGTVALGAGTYNTKLPAFIGYHITPPVAYTRNIALAAWWCTYVNLYIPYGDSGHVYLSGQGPGQTTVNSGPGAVFFAAGMATARPVPTTATAIHIQPASQGQQTIIVENSAQAATLTAGQDVFIYTGFYGTSMGIGGGCTDSGVGGTQCHFDELNTIVSVSGNSVTLLHPLVRKYWNDGNDSFGMVTVPGGVHDVAIENMTLNLSGMVTDGGNVSYDELVDNIVIPTSITIRVFGGGYKRGMVVSNSSWGSGDNTVSWDGTDEFDQSNDIAFVNNAIRGNQSPGAEGPSNGARIYGTEGSSEFLYANNDFHNEEIGFQDTGNVIVVGNRFYDGFMGIGTVYNGTQWNVYSSQSQNNIVIMNNLVELDANSAAPWAISVGTFKNSNISGNTIVSSEPGNHIAISSYSPVQTNSITFGPGVLGTPVAVYTDVPLPTQIGKEFYSITPQIDSEKCLDINADSKSSEALTHVWDCLNLESQRFQFVPISGAFGDGYQIVDKNSGLCLDVSGVSKVSGGIVWQYQCIGVNQLNQIWQAVPVGSSYQFRSINSGMCLELVDDNTTNGTGYVQAPCVTTVESQLFNLQAQPENNVVQSLGSTTYKVKLDWNPGKCLDLSGAVSASATAALGNGVATAVNDCVVGDDSQIWNLVPQVGSYGVGYQLVNVGTGKCLDVSGNVQTNGTKLDQWSCVGATQLNQIWQFHEYNGVFQLVVMNSGSCMDLTSGNETDGNAFQQYTCGAGNINQLFDLVPGSD